MGHHVNSMNNLTGATGDTVKGAKDRRNVRSNANSVERPSNTQDSPPKNATSFDSSD